MQLGEDFTYLDSDREARGSRAKKNVLLIESGERAFLKYKAEGYITSELASEKIAYELAKVLGFECARIEFAQDEDGEYAVLNYLFSDLSFCG